MCVTSPTAQSDSIDLHWTPAGDYTLALDGTTVRARNSKGKDLKSVPAKVKKTDEYLQLDALATWLTQHERSCADTVRGWFLSGEQVAVALLAAVWVDPSWQKYVKDLVVQASNPGTAEQQITGLLRDADEHALRLVDLDGETTIIPVTTPDGIQTTVTVPHPVLIEDIDDWREFAVELGVTQGTDQLFREVHHKPDTTEGRREALTRYAGARYEQGTVLMGRSKGAGYETTRFEVSLRVNELVSVDAPSATATTVFAVLSIDCGNPFDEGTIDDLNFVSPGAGRLDPVEVGPVAWSEGIRMAEFVYSGRTIEDSEGNE